MRCGHGLSEPCATSRAGTKDASQRGPQRRRGGRGHQTRAAPSSTCRGQGTRRQANTESKAPEARAQQTESILRRNLAQETCRLEGDASRPRDGGPPGREECALVQILRESPPAWKAAGTKPSRQSGRRPGIKHEISVQPEAAMAADRPCRCVRT